MTYSFEDLPTTNQNIRTQKIMLNGRQVAVLEHLSHHSKFDQTPRDWRVFRLSDRRQVLNSAQSLEMAQRHIQALDPAIFDDIESREWTVVAHTVYGYRYFVGMSEDYPSLQDIPCLQTMADAGRFFDEIAKDRSIYLPSQGDALTRIELVNFTNLKEVVRAYNLVPQ